MGKTTSNWSIGTARKVGQVVPSCFLMMLHLWLVVSMWSMVHLPRN